MSRHSQPKGKVNRALGMVIYEKRGAVKALERREYRPGMHGQRKGKVSEYGLALREKKKIKHYYGLHERQLVRFYQLATKSPENTGTELLVLCERRLDNVVRRAGFARTRDEARQGVNHGHFQVNGRKVDVASYLVKAGDVVAVKARPNLQKKYRERLTEGLHSADWLVSDAEALSFTVTRLPADGDVSLPVDIQRVIEILSR
ncbi:30S ribosomal protein S4 [Gemmata obscuriglobus]|uniref:Small ribosomal subunit protein uS4 n=2 Tax=Gemmata TaxID=113 RepID=A0A2Z3H6X0_9BACT|nr:MULTISPECIES: 30S ribosomal protein S4 [Gemmata]AWM39336.1 30S ribosomal protein S4 [Gemmata obscuriglobus]MDY3554362.1 30S ribosomal protein S4 [Gemmata algarum]MDY3563356.1 30S ribosomal protein S4 [Gemmata algarum]QEG27599.1 30S ribosomal protein S4 [Gemmata obscuriglobus]VTS04721.1 30s ribosomal protein s4 : 30S ribosomal protein S4 OS=Planctomyces maris DSM 8797 GN=rpsD PE=3 SV=1: Ribosomal_S4: S4 [Gemmata obscuriglobus UQM 2246]